MSSNNPSREVYFFMSGRRKRARTTNVSGDSIDTMLREAVKAHENSERADSSMPASADSSDRSTEDGALSGSTFDADRLADEPAGSEPLADKPVEDEPFAGNFTGSRSYPDYASITNEGRDFDLRGFDVVAGESAAQFMSEDGDYAQLPNPEVQRKIVEWTDRDVKARRDWQPVVPLGVLAGTGGVNCRPHCKRRFGRKGKA